MRRRYTGYETEINTFDILFPEFLRYQVKNLKGL